MTKQPRDEPPASAASVPDNVIDLAAAKRRFLAATADIDAATIVQALTDAANARLDRSKKPLPLLTPPATPVRFQVRVDLIGSKPPIWRALTLPSNLTFDAVHDVLQTAFGWTNSHLHRFGLPGDPYGNETEGILMPFDIEEGEQGVLESELRLDQLLTQPGDALVYTYDFGDDWEHTVTLEAIEPLRLTDAAPLATREAAVRCLDGSRQGPQEDVGGIHGWEGLLAIVAGRTSPAFPEQLDQIAHLRFGSFTDEIDIDAINRGFDRLLGADDALARLRQQSFPGTTPSALAALVAGVGEEAQRHLAGYLAVARIDEPVQIDEAEAAAATAVYRTFLGHVGDGIRLSKAGYLPPATVTAIMDDLDPEKLRYGQGNRENNIPELMALREVATRLGLVRKSQGELKLTKRGEQLREAPVKLWLHLASQLPLEKAGFGRESALLLLMLVAADEARDVFVVMESLDLLMSIVGWETQVGSPFGTQSALSAAAATRHALEWAGTGSLLPGKGSYRTIYSGDGARRLARAALRNAAGAGFLVEVR